MKKMRKSLLTIGLTGLFLVGITIPVSAITGSWTSSFGYDANGISKIGSSNAMTSSKWFQFQVRGAGGVVLSHSNKQLGSHQRYSENVYSAPLQQKQGAVSVSPDVSHVPFFSP